MNATSKNGLDSAHWAIRQRPFGRRRVFVPIERAGRIKIDVGLIGKNSIHGNERKMCVDFLFYATLILGMKIFHDEDAFADLIKLFNAPSGVIDICKLLFGV